MKKIIRTILVIISCAVIFTGCVSEQDLNGSYVVENETINAPESEEELTDEDGYIIVESPFQGIWYCGGAIEIDEPISSEVSDNISWTIDNGVLTIYGTGDMVTNGRAPWMDYSSDITAVIIEEGVTSIDESAFYGFQNLTYVEFHDGLTYIGDKAFGFSRNLTNIEIPGSVNYIGEDAFKYCGLQNITVAPDNPVYDSRDNCNAIIKSDINELMVGCQNSVIPDGIISIGSKAFYEYEELDSINIPDSVTYIGESAFYGCTDLTSIDIPEGVININYHAFCDCLNLTSVTIPHSVAYMDKDSFLYCTELKTFKYAGTLEEWKQLTKHIR